MEKASLGQQITITHNVKSHFGEETFEDNFLIIEDLGNEKFLVLEPDQLKPVYLDIPQVYGTKLQFYGIQEPGPILKAKLLGRINSVLNYIPTKIKELEIHQQELLTLKTKLNAVPNTVQT